MYERILVPTDGSEQASNAVPHALDIAGKYGATVHALCVVSERAAIGNVPPTRAEGTVEALRQEADAVVTAVASEAADVGVECVTAVREGDPSEAIVDYIEEEGIDMVVIGGRKRSPAGKVLFGSVTQSVILHADVPVTVVG